MNRYKVPVFVYVDAETEKEAEDLVTQMLCGVEVMSTMWDVGDAEKRWEHSK